MSDGDDPQGQTPTQPTGRAVDKAFLSERGTTVTTTIPEPFAASPSTNLAKVEVTSEPAPPNKPKRALAEHRQRPTRIDHRMPPNVIMHHVLDERLEKLAFAPRSRSRFEGLTSAWIAGAVGLLGGAVQSGWSIFISPPTSGLTTGLIAGAFVNLAILLVFIGLATGSMFKSPQEKGPLSADLLQEIRSQSDKARAGDQ